MKRYDFLRLLVPFVALFFLWKCAAPLPSVEGLPCEKSAANECGADLLCAADGFCRRPCPDGSCPTARTCVRGECVALPTEPTSDAAEPLPETKPEAKPETKPETNPETKPDVSSSCQSGEVRPCTPPASPEKMGRCAKGVETCKAGVWGVCVALISQTERCSGEDDDCDGHIDDGTVCTLIGPVETTLDGEVSQARFYFPRGVAYHKGLTFVTEDGAHQVRLIEEINNKRTVTTIAGRNLSGFQDGPGEKALFNRPTGVAVDSAGRVFVVDTENHSIRMLEKIESGVCGTVKGYAGWCVSTIAGTDTAGSTDTPNPILFNRPTGIAILSDELYIADTGNHTVRHLLEGSKGWESKTILGLVGQPGEGKPKAIQLNGPQGLSVDPSTTPATLYIADTNNGRILQATLAKEEWTASVFGSATLPLDIAIDASDSPNSAYIVQRNDSHIIHLQSGTSKTYAGKVKAPGDANGALGLARFFFPRGIAQIQGNTFLVADHNNHLVRLLEPNQVSTFAGSKVRGLVMAEKAKDARIDQPLGILAHPTEDVIYVSLSRHGHLARRDADGKVETLWSKGIGFADGPLAKVQASGVRGLAMDKKGIIYFVDQGNHAIRKLEFFDTPETCGQDKQFMGGCVTTIAGDCKEGRTPSACLPGFVNGPGPQAKFSSPGYIAIDPTNDKILYVTDTNNHAIRKIEFLTTGTCPSGANFTIGWCVTTIAGTGVVSTPGVPPKNGAGVTATFSFPKGIVARANGVLFVADINNHVIRTMQIVKSGEMCAGNKLTRDTWCVGILAGSGKRGVMDGVLLEASFTAPYALALDDDDKATLLYVGGLESHLIRVIDLSEDADERKVSTIAGSGLEWGHRDGLLKNAGGLGVLFNSPSAIALDKDRNLVIADWANHRVRKLTFPLRK